MGKILGRIGALVIAVLFLVTSLGFSLLVIWQAHQQNQKDTAATQSSQTTPATDTSCQIGSATGPQVAKPAVYKPTGNVTALQTTDLTVGSGPAVKAGDCLQVKYQGSLATTGSVFDENFDKPELLKFQIGVGNVIPGWDQGLIGMKAGGVRRLVIPASLAYGSQAQTGIPANSALVFIVSLAKIGQ